MSTLTSAAATIIKATANGVSTTGPIAIPGLQVGDVLVQVVPDGFLPGQGLEKVVSVAGQIQQVAPYDWSGVNLTLYLIRGV